MVEHLLHGSPASSAGIKVVVDALAAIAAEWPRDRKLRVLELGADGGATRQLIERLARSGVAVAYTASTADPEQAAWLSALVSGYAGADACCWSAREDAEAPGGPFDVILSAHAAARLQIDGPALTSVHDRLAPGGLFIAVEPAPNPLWDIVFGRHAGWWQSDAGVLENSPLRSLDEWQGAHVQAGFASVGAVPLARGPWPSSVVWGRARPSSTTAAPHPATALTVSLVGSGGGDAVLRERLLDAGHRVGRIDAEELTRPPYDPDDGDEAAIILVVDEESGDPVAQAARLIARAARLAEAAARRRIPLWLVTSGAQQPRAGDAVGVVGAALWGFGRVLMNEIPRLSLRLVDFNPATGWAERADRLIGELAAAPPETEIVWTEAGRHVLRLRRGLPPRRTAGAESLALNSAHRGGLDALRWQVVAPHQPGPGEVTIDIQAAGINFRDMMWALGLLPEEALIDGFAGPTFGLECAGIVSAVGAGVDDLAVGDRVAGFAPAALATQATTAAHAVMRIPPEIGFAEAATIPVAFVTVVYALGTLAQLAPSEHVLVHAAAGGVGLAAIQYAKHRGAVVIATAGSETKRAFLRRAGADYVLDSRDLGFADAVRAITGGAGVDVVLNSLSGEAMEQSLGVLKPFGRFLELGKRDFYQNRRIHLRPLRRNVSYFAIDVDQLPVQRPDLARTLLSEVSGALRDGAIRPLAHRTFPYAAIGEAFRLMQASGHIGKLVLVPEGNEGVRLRSTVAMALRPDGTYLVTGGISGFGFAAARWLAQHSAGSIALLSRRGAETPGAAERVAELTALGAEVRVYAGDVADPYSLALVLDEIRRMQPPLRGVIHAASAVEDALVAEIDEASVAAILRPKLAGALALDRLTRDDPLDLFVLFSSATTLLGAPGQGAYVAANVALEGVARRRQAAGRPALAIAWGPIEDAGYLADRPQTRDALVRRLGARPMTAAQALGGLEAALASGLPAVALAETSWNEVRRYLPILATLLFTEMRGDAVASESDDSLIERLRELDAEGAAELLKTVVGEEAAKILRLPASGIEPLRPLSEIGMDSLMAVELRLALESRLRIDLPLMSLAEGTSVASIAARLASAVASRSQASELVSLAERYELAGEERLAEVAGAAGDFDPLEVKSEAAE
jgi:NADPH:quinone reductase-like Zn-dependent oxidoreductase/NAD(P)-dependent dehydrogenase (short-subunit alcohol dehydrogenase family)/acyl carrier protein